MKRRLLPLLLAVCLLTDCAPKEEAKPLDEAHRFAAEVNTARKALLESGAFPDFSDVLRDCETDLTPSEPLTLGRSYAGTLTKAQAAQDVEALFSLLRSSYAGYDYFGGDGVFLPAKEAALAALDGMGSYIKTERLIEAISSSLSPALQDGHFVLNGVPLVEDKQQYMYYVPDLYLPDGSGPDGRYIKPTIGPDGALSYCFAALSRDGDDLPAEVTLEGKPTALSWVRADVLPEQGEPAYTRDEAEGVPILVNRSMGAVDPNLYQQQYEALRSFWGSGEEWGKEPLFLLDIRGNTGGQPAFCRGWFEGLTGQAPQPRSLEAVRNSKAVEEDEVLPSFYQGLGLELNSPGAWTTKTNEGRWTENKSLIFVLMDKTTVSAAEFFVRDLRTLDNVVFVGSNTSGGALAGGIRYFQLPNSGVYFSFGTMLSLAEDGSNVDGVGYLPDLWVNPADAQDAVLRLIRHYGLA